MFPEITGIGKDEARAVEALADSLAVKMGSVVKSVLDEFLKKDLLRLFKAEARLRENNRPLFRNAIPPLRRPNNAGPLERKITFDMPPLDIFLQDTGLNLNKNHPAVRGLIMVLGLHAVHKDLARRLTWLEQEHLTVMENQLLRSMLDNGAFDTLQPTGHRTPFGMMLGIPMSFN